VAGILSIEVVAVQSVVVEAGVVSKFVDYRPADLVSQFVRIRKVFF
jgi:hypothetical protein